MRFTFKKDERLRKQREFENVFENGRWVNGKYVDICFALDQSRKVGFIVSKKISKKAVIRNKVKRRLREIFRLNKYDLPDTVNLIIVAKKGVEKVSFSDLEDEVRKLFKKISDIVD
ncbi:ribonuclease P protein component [Deferribacter thermophilus]|uniref:ribonuclease P protein component n=1 Tax=Deferribacter thermophilus TaxID=53573 RepID=UPI003C2255DA